MAKVRNQNTLERISKIVEELAKNKDKYQVLYDMFEIMAITIANSSYRTSKWQERENRYLEIINKYSSQEVDLIIEAFGILNIITTEAVNNMEFEDWLGKLYMNSGVQSKEKGQFFTPYSVSKITAELTINIEEIKEKIASDPEYVFKIGDPCCGAGSMSIALVESLYKNGIGYSTNTLFVCDDKDLRCCYMCYIQLSLLGVPAVIRHMDTLYNEVYDTFFTPAYCKDSEKFSKA